MADTFQGRERPDLSAADTGTGRTSADPAKQQTRSVFDMFAPDPNDEYTQKLLDELFDEILAQPRDDNWRDIEW